MEVENEMSCGIPSSTVQEMEDGAGWETSTGVLGMT